MEVSKSVTLSRQEDRERRARARLAVDADHTVMCVHDVLDHRESKTRTLRPARARARTADELVEDLLLLLARDPGSFIANPDGDTFRRTAGLDGDGGGSRRVLRGVVEQVPDGAAERLAVGADGRE